MGSGATTDNQSLEYSAMKCDHSHQMEKKGGKHFCITSAQVLSQELVINVFWFSEHFGF